MYYLLDDAADSYQDLYRRFLGKSEWRAKFSEKYIADAIHTILSQIWDGEDPTNVPMLVEDLVRTLDSYNEEQAVYVPLVGVAMGIESVQFGRITIRLMTDEKVDELIREHEAKIRASSLDQETQERSLQRATQALYEPLRKKVVAEYRVVAEPTRAQERAEDEVHRVLDLLRYAIPHIFKKGVSIAVGMVGGSQRASEKSGSYP